MRTVRIVTPCVLLAAIAVWLFVDTKETIAEKAGKEEPRRQPVSVLIVKEGLHSRAGIGRMSAVSIVNRKMIERLERFFPGYAKYPSSEVAAPWKAGYRVYFNFPGGRTIRVTVAANDAGKTWSIGKGDFETKGDFEKFIKDLPAPARR